MGSRKVKIIQPEQLTTKTLSAVHYIGTITCECVSSKRHKKKFSPAQLAEGPPICDVDHCGMPMIPVKAEAKMEVKNLHIKVEGPLVELDTLDPKDAPAIAREIKKQKKRAKRRK